jgi:hypothetical protein
MDRKPSRWALAVTAVLVAAQLLIPPWRTGSVSISLSAGGGSFSASAGATSGVRYLPIFAPPEGSDGIAVDRLAIQLGVTIVLGLLLLFLSRRSSRA